MGTVDTVGAGDTFDARPGYVTVLFFDGISAATGTALKKTDAFDVVSIGVAASAAFRAQTRAQLGLRPG